MSYRVVDVRISAYPDTTAAELALAAGGLSISEVERLLRSFICTAPLSADEGYQMAIASELESHLEESLLQAPTRVRASRQYHPSLNEEADVAIEVTPAGKRIYIELEFRPNVEKDLVKFQIGAHCGRLLVGILVVALDRNTINARYTSMPEYRKFTKLIEALRPNYPLLLCGISGTHE